MSDSPHKKCSTALPGDERELRTYQLNQIFSRTLFFVELEEALTGIHEYAVDVNFDAEELSVWDMKSEQGHRATDESPAALYRNGTQILRSNLPAVFPVPGGQIEVAARVWGLRRMHYVRDSGEEHVLRPDRRSPEGLRALFGSRAPRASRAIGRVAAVVLLAALVFTLPQALQTLTEIETIAQHLGTFTSPFHLPDWANSMLILAAALAAVERALTLRWHWLVDFDTSWGDSE